LSARTRNKAEIAVLIHLSRHGWTVVNRGWPNFLAIKDGQVRLIEVKRRRGARLTPNQQKVADILAVVGLKVEILSPLEVKGGL
jgi:Holliday junction resolvase